MIVAGIHSDPFTTKHTKRFPVPGARPDMVAMPVSALFVVLDHRFSSCTSCASWFKILSGRPRTAIARHRRDR
jgi:hypothetical protein